MSTDLTPTLDTLCNAILTGTIKTILVLTGAGISTSAGIPDFRSPTSGLYAKLAPLQLPYPEAIFHISYFRHTPEPFYAIARARHPRNLKPTISHAFLALLEKKGLLGYVFSQNIDRLEVDAGVPEGKLLNVHGNWKGQGCIICKARYPDDLMKSAIQSGQVPVCIQQGCGGTVKPDIVMFGESLPGEFEKKEKEWVGSGKADMVLAMGSSLKVAPASMVPRKVGEGVRRVLVNREVVGDFGSREGDVCLLGECDEKVREVAKKLGWEEELETLHREAVERKERELEMEEWDGDNVPTLDECIASAAEKMKMRMGVSEGHRKMLEGHLGEKLKNISLGGSNKPC
ncbi:DHS-like NAD/FAD-binding domain-containing protein [Aspergillus unguis]